MIDCGAASSRCCSLDPDKRVNYSLGLVLGLDEFDQEQFYFLERDRQHNRALHGYGTVCGLRLTIEGTKVTVGAGLAVNPRGKVVRVARDQCADLNDWLAVPANRRLLVRPGGSPVESPVGSPPAGPLDGARLYVVLCDRECETDPVPVPGAPCRSEEDNLVPSRVTESFEVKLSPTPPQAAEEQAVRAFGRLLRRVEVAAGPPPVIGVADLVGLVRGLAPVASPVGSPVASPVGSPVGEPPSSGPLRLAPEDAAPALRAAFRVWVTEVRPALLGDGQNCAGGPPDERCVLLGTLAFDVLANGRIGPAGSPTIAVDEEERPLLLQTRLLQELGTLPL